MAVRFDASADKLTRSSAPTTTAVTVTAWLQRSAAVSGAFQYPLGLSNSGDAAYMLFGTDPGKTTWEITSTRTLGHTQFSTNGDIVDGAWYFAALVCTGTGASGLTGYLSQDFGAIESRTAGGVNVSSPILFIGNDDSGEYMDGRMAAVKVWSAGLTAAEIAQERKQILPVRLANFWALYPLWNASDDTVDYSGAGRTLTVGGTLATEDGPPIPWKMGRHRYPIKTAAVASDTLEWRGSYPAWRPSNIPANVMYGPSR